MRKLLITFLVLVMAIACFTSVLTASAGTDIAVSDTENNRGYFKVDGNAALKSLDFEDGIVGVDPRWGTLSSETAAPIGGSGSLKSVAGDAGYAMESLKFDGTSVGQAEGTYYIQFDFVATNLKAVFVQVERQYHVRVTEVGFSLENSQPEVVPGGTSLGGWGDADTTYKNANIVALDNGVYRCYFEYDVAAGLEWEANAPYIVFAQNATVAGDNSLVLDNIEFGKVGKDSYYNIDWDVDYGTVADDIWGSQPVWANSGSVVPNYFGDKSALKIVSPAGTNNGTVGGFDNQAANLEGKKLVKVAARTYFQFDIDVTNCSMVNIWSSGLLYTSVQFNGSSWRTEGAVENFKAEALEKGYRLSYFIDLTNNRDLELSLNTTSDGEGAVYIGNLVVAHQDDVCAPWTADSSYSSINTQDVVVDVDLKGKDLVSLTMDSTVVEADKYSYADGKPTLNKSLFDTKLDSYVFELQTSGGSSTFAVKKMDDIKDITASVVEGQDFTKYHDGTTTVHQAVQLQLNGVESGDEVTVSATAQYESAEVGDEVVVNITDIVLGGKDAYKYNLTTTELTATGKILALVKINLVYNGQDIFKIYDGTTNVNEQIKLDVLDENNQPIAELGDVTISFDAAFDSAMGGDRVVTLTDFTLGGSDAHKYEILTQQIEIPAWITVIEDVDVSDNKGYYTYSDKALVKIDFEDYEVGAVGGSEVSGLYTQLAPEIVMDGDNKVYKVEKNCDPWATELFSTNTTGGYRTPGVYAVDFRIKPVNSSLITAIVRNSYANDTSGILADFRWIVTNDTNGIAVSVEKEIGGWTGDDQKYFNGSAEVDPATGWITCHFEFELSADVQFQDQYLPNITFMCGDNSDLSTYYFDDFVYSFESTPDKYMTIDTKYDMDNIQGNVWEETPFWLQTGTLEAKDGAIFYTVGANFGNREYGDPIGGIRNRVTDADKFLKGSGLHFIQFDIDTTCTWAKLYSAASEDGKVFNYFAITVTNDEGYLVLTSEGNIQKLSVERLDNDMLRVSFYLDMTGYDIDGTDLRINALTGAEGGYVKFDNVSVCYEDYSPMAQDGTYNFINTEDVAVSVDLKGARLEQVLLDGVVLNTQDYTFSNGILTLSKALFANDTLQTPTRKLQVVSHMGTTEVDLSIVDNREEVAVSYDGPAISKEYDGTTDVADLILSLQGVASGDDVTVTFDKVYSSKNAGQVTIEITNIVLSGADAGKYKLANTTLTINATITKKALTVSGTTVADKTYDGTTNATATAGTLNGLIEGDQVTLGILSALFNSKDVATANKVTVTYTLEGADSANYTVTATEEFAKTIAKKQITVVADALSKIASEEDPALTYSVTGLIEGDSLQGQLEREAGEEVGEYAISIGSLANDNYDIKFTSAKFTIEKQPVNVGLIVGVVVAVVVVGGATAGFVVVKRRKSLTK